MLKQVELFQAVNKIPPAGLTTEKTQAGDLLENFRRREEAKEEPQGRFMMKEEVAKWIL